MTLFKAGGSRLTHEIAILAIMAVLAAAYFIVMRPAGTTKTPTKSTQLNTTFDTNTLDQVEKKDNNYPTIPSTGTGRPDPYAP